MLKPCWNGGYKVVDLGKDVPLKQFVDSVESEHADVLCMSTLMTTTMDGMGTVVNMLKSAACAIRLRS